MQETAHSATKRIELYVLCMYYNSTQVGEHGKSSKIHTPVFMLKDARPLFVVEEGKYTGWYTTLYY